MGPWAISLLMIAGFGGFAALAWRKIAIFRALAAGGALGQARRAPGARGHDGPRAVAHGGRRVEAGDHARGHLPGLLRAPRQEAPPHRHRLRPARHHPRRGGGGLRALQGFRRGRRAAGGGLRVLAALRPEAPAPGAQPRGDPDPFADPRDHRLGLPLRRPALRDVRLRPGHRARARLRPGGRGGRDAVRRGLARVPSPWACRSPTGCR